jgi:methionyl-tRNA formyltransferase
VTSSVRVTFLGNDPWSVPALRALVASVHQVVAVVTSEPKPAGRGSRLTPTAVAEAARTLGVRVLEVGTVRAGPGRAALASTAPEVLAVVAYGELLPPEVLQLPTIAPVNLHFSLLPELRGASPVQTALLVGLRRTGVTTIVMDEGMDTGPVILQRPETIDAGDDAGSLGGRLAELGAGVLAESVGLLASGEVEPRPQDHAAATFAPRLGPSDRVLDFARSAEALVNRCRAFAPRPGATTAFRGAVLKVFRAEVAAVEGLAAAGEPGTIVEVGPAGFVVATPRGGFRPLEVALAGRRRMSGADLVHGYRPQVGERLG